MRSLASSSKASGTPAPVAPTERLVVGGVYRYVRNPMYLAVGATICGQALLLGQWGTVAYAALFFAIVATFVITYKERTSRGSSARTTTSIGEPCPAGCLVCTRGSGQRRS